MADKIAKATLKLYVFSVDTPSSFDVLRVTGAWDEGTINPATGLTLVPEVVGVSVTRPLSFVVIDLTQLVKLRRRQTQMSSLWSAPTGRSSLLKEGNHLLDASH